MSIKERGQNAPHILRGFLIDCLQDGGFCFGRDGHDDEHAWGTCCNELDRHEADGYGREARASRALPAPRVGQGSERR